MNATGRKSMVNRISALAAVAVLSFTAERASAVVYTYDNTSSVGVTDNSCGAAPAGGIDRTFTVPSTDSFTVSTIALGLNVSHVTRGQLRVTILAPGGTSSTVVATSGDTDDNYDILLSSNSEGAIDDNDTDPTAEPTYNRLVSVAAGTMNFYTGNSVGTWTVRICDNTAGTTGTFNSARLILTSAAALTARCTSTTTFDFGDWAAPLGTGDCDVQFTTNTTGSITTTLGSGANAPTQYGAPGIAIGSTGGTPNYVTRSNVAPCTNNPQGNHQGYYALSMDGGSGVDGESFGERVTFDFSPAVTDLSTSLLDVDWQAASGWEDQATLRAFDAAGNVVPYTITPHPANQIAGNLAEGDASAAVNSDTSRVDYTFSRGVSRVQVTYSQGDEGAGGSPAETVFQIIGIADFTMCAYDFGDAPTSYGSAGHNLGTGTVYMGSNPPDGEGTTPGAPGTAATVDDSNAPGGATPDDEDGISSFPSVPGLRAGSTYTVSNIPVFNNTGAAVTICGWIDFDLNGQAGDGTFAADEGSCRTTATCTGAAPNFTCSLSWTVPADFQVNNSNPTYARFRVSSAALTTSSFSDGGTPNSNPGEVEDYQIPAGTLPVTVAFAWSSETGIEWTTSSETSNIGFRVLARAVGSKRLVELGRVASESLDSAEPRSYSLPFSTRLAAGSTLFIEEIDAAGKTRRHGPFALGKAWGERPQRHDINWEAVRNEVADARRNAEVASVAEARILISKPGIQRLTHADLLAAGVDLTGVATSQISLTDAGKPVARFIAAGEFSKVAAWTSDSFLEFTFEPKLTLASPYDALELRVRSGAWVASTDAAPASGETVLVQAKTDFARNRQYSSASPNGDPWFDERVLAFGAPATLSRSFDLPNLASGSVSLKLDLWGVTSWPGNTPDHHVVVRLNGSELESSFFDGLTPWTRTFDVSGRVSATGNQIEIALPFDTGYSFDLVHLEGFSVSYPKAAVATEGRLEGETRSKAPWLVEAPVEGFTDGTVSFWAGTTRTELPVGKAGSVIAPAVIGRFALAEPSAQRVPQVVAGIPYAGGKRLAGDYLIVTHPDLASAAAPLVALQLSRGFSVELATTDQIYARHSDHAPSAEAIRQYIAGSGKKLKYVLLVGAESYDPYDYLGLGSISYVPTSYTPFNEFVAFGPSDDVTADRDGDRVPDVSIGRLPVKTPAELAAVIDKMVAWQGRAAAKTALVAAGKSAEGDRSVAGVGDAHAAALGSWAKQLSFVDDSSLAVVRADVLAAMNAGTPLVSYVGHSSYGQWDSTPVLKWEDVATFANVGQPNLVVQWGCWNAYFASPEVETLSNRLLLTPNVGAAAVIGSTALTSTQSHQALGEAFLARISAGDATLGQAFLNAKRHLAATNPGALDAIMGQALLGDPATPLPR